MHLSLTRESAHMRLQCLLLFFAALPTSARAQAPRYDLVLTGGRIIDPASKLDGIRSVGITGHRIAAISAGPLAGRVTVDVKGLVRRRPSTSRWPIRSWRSPATASRS